MSKANFANTWGQTNPQHNKHHTEEMNRKTISLPYIYRNFYVSDTRRKPSPSPGYTRLRLNDGINTPSFTGIYDIPSRMVDDCLNHYEQDGTQTVEFSLL